MEKVQNIKNPKVLSNYKKDFYEKASNSTVLSAEHIKTQYLTFKRELLDMKNLRLTSKQSSASNVTLD